MIKDTVLIIIRYCQRCKRKLKHVSTVERTANGGQVETIRCADCGDTKTYEVV